MKHLLIVPLLLALTACQTAYYAAWEKVGIEKRDILVDRVEDAKESQEEAQQQFSSALDEFSQLINFDGGEFQSVYEQLKDQYEASEESAASVTSRIDKVESVAEALFDEWQEELETYSNLTLKRDSQMKLKDTQRNYKSLVSAMRKAEGKMAPVLSALKDNVLYLKHNLNASAIGALQGEFSGIKKEINQLVAEMNTAISESNKFIKVVANKIVEKLMAAYYGPIINNNMQFIEQHLAHNEWFAGKLFTGADIQMSFPLEAAVARGAATDLPNITRFVGAIHKRSAYQQALAKGGQYDYA